MIKMKAHLEGSGTDRRKGKGETQLGMDYLVTLNVVPEREREHEVAFVTSE